MFPPTCSPARSPANARLDDASQDGSAFFFSRALSRQLYNPSARLAGGSEIIYTITKEPVRG
jgi:hypothetical protein